jgi:hypothetical protein
MTRVFWFNGGGTFYEDVPSDQARELIRHLMRTGFVVWSQQLTSS